jgi:carbon-monoxide dehydrogenase medium subunit
MIPAAFDYTRATSLAHAIDLLVEHEDGAKIVAGGHTLIPTLKLRLASPSLLIDIRGIPELSGIAIGDSISIGALTTHAQLLYSKDLNDLLPIFGMAASIIADPQVRNRGTIGGSLANADPAADWPAVVIALKAELELSGAGGARRILARDFFTDIMTTALGPEEILTRIHIKRPKPGTRFCYRKIRHPASGYAVVGVAVGIAIADGVVSEPSIGITGATGRAFSPDAATEFLIGKPLMPEVIDRAAFLASEQEECLEDHYASSAYRRHLLKTELSRALLALRETDA